MNYKDILRNKPWLRLYNTGNVTNRLLKKSNGNAFIVYNLIQAEFQLHTVEAEELSGDSTNANIPLEVINQWIIDDYDMKDFNKYVDDLRSEQQIYECLRDGYEKFRRTKLLDDQLKVVERVMGTKI
jgi:hypothetical protein